MPREDAKDAIFWDMFEVRNPHTGELAEPWVPCEAAAGRRQKFVLHKVRVSAAGTERLLTMRFRCALPARRLITRSCVRPCISGWLRPPLGTLTGVLYTGTLTSA